MKSQICMLQLLYHHSLDHYHCSKETPGKARASVSSAASGASRALAKLQETRDGSIWGLQAALSDVEHNRMPNVQHFRASLANFKAGFTAIDKIIREIQSSAQSGVGRIERMKQQLSLLEEELSWEGDLSNL